MPCGLPARGLLLLTAILGISAFYHDSAAALVVDGEIMAAAQEERFTRRKHDHEFPIHAIDFCLEQCGLRPEQIDYAVFYDKPLLKFDRLIETYLAFAPRGYRSFLMAMPLWLKQKLHLTREIRAGLRGAYRKRVAFTFHHDSHAASAFLPSPFDEAAILTLDGVGEWATASIGHGRGNRIDMLRELRFPHSLGLLYSAFTYYCGFRVNSGEYKLMGLAPYGQPTYERQIREHLLDLKDDGSFRLDLRYFNYCQGLTMTSPKFHDLFGGPPRSPEAELTQRHMDLAASIQKVTADIMVRCARTARRLTGARNLCLAGGVALNCVGNGRILREGIFESLWVQPAAGDAGGALGAALYFWHQTLNKPRSPQPHDSQKGSLLGPVLSEEGITCFLDSVGAVYTRHGSDESLCAEVASLIASEKVVGWVSGPMEFGPRALGARSILGDPRSPAMQSTMNLKIKFRESFRPFAPAVLQDRAPDWFDLQPGQESPYMLLVAPVREDRRIDTEGAIATGIEKLKQLRSQIPAVTHVDHSARVQTVDPQRNPRFHRLLTSFESLTGCPVLINTSFNVRGEPIVCTHEDAWRCFLGTNMDVLVLERFVLHKDRQPESLRQDNADYLTNFKLD